MSLFKSNWGKWVPLGNWSFEKLQYITFARKNSKTGLIDFKSKRVNSCAGAGGCVGAFVPSDLINTAEAWKKLNEI